MIRRLPPVRRGGRDPVVFRGTGRLACIENVPFTVIGLLKSSGASAGGQDQDDVIYVPLNTAQIRLTETRYVSWIQVQAAQSGEVATVVDEVTTLLQRRHNKQAGGTNDFTVMNRS